MTVVTISASYGARGADVGRAVAHRLGLRLYDREIPAEVARRLSVPLETALALDEAVPALGERLIGGLSPLAAWPCRSTLGMAEREFRAATELVIADLAARGAAVVLGRAAALTLGDAPGTLHVRLGGPVARRTAQASRLHGIPPGHAGRRRRAADRASRTYVRRLYGADPSDADLYHVVLDTTVLGPATCAEIIACAARARDSEAPRLAEVVRLPERTDRRSLAQRRP